MKKYVMNFLMNKIKNTNAYDETKLAEIKYGLESVYLTLSKLIIIFIAAYFLDLFKELIIFIVFYNLIRMPSFGLHATKSWICLISSLIIFILIPYMCKIIIIPIYIKSLLGLFSIYWFYKYAPADTKKRPIINQKRRMVYKFLSVTISIIFSISSLIIANPFISNCLIISLIVQSFIISPYVYRIFNLSYDNYKSYLSLNTV